MWYEILKKLRRFTLSESSKIHDIPELAGYRPPVSNKPAGVWYSFTLGRGGWLHKTLYEYGWIKKYKYILELDISNLRVLKINNEKQLEEFDKKYGVDSKEFGRAIRWDKSPFRPELPAVKEDYDGIEIRNIDFNWHKLDWVDGWDLDSGCIWKTNGMKVIKVKEVEKRHLDEEDKFRRETREMFE